MKDERERWRSEGFMEEEEEKRKINVKGRDKEKKGDGRTDEGWR